MDPADPAGGFGVGFAKNLQDLGPGGPYGSAGAFLVFRRSEAGKKPFPNFGKP